MSIELDTIQGWRYVATMTRAGTIHAKWADGSTTLLLETFRAGQAFFYALSGKVVISDDACLLRAIPDGGKGVDEALVTSAVQAATGSMQAEGDNLTTPGGLSLGGVLDARGGLHTPNTPQLLPQGVPNRDMAAALGLLASLSSTAIPMSAFGMYGNGCTPSYNNEMDSLWANMSKSRGATAEFSLPNLGYDASEDTIIGWIIQGQLHSKITPCYANMNGLEKKVQQGADGFAVVPSAYSQYNNRVVDVVITMGSVRLRELVYQDKWQVRTITLESEKLDPAYTSYDQSRLVCIRDGLQFHWYIMLTCGYACKLAVTQAPSNPTNNSRTRLAGMMCDDVGKNYDTRISGVTLLRSWLGGAAAIVAAFDSMCAMHAAPTATVTIEDYVPAEH